MNNYMNDDNYVPKAFRKSKKNKEINFEETPKKRSKKHISKRNKKINIKQIKTKKIIMLIIIAIILILAIWVGVTTHRWKSLAKDMMIQENSVVKDIDNNTIAEIRSKQK